MKRTIKEIEHDALLRIIDEKQKKILEESMKPGVESSQFVEEWNFFRSIRDGLKKEIGEN